MGCRQADAAEQAAWRSTGERLPCPQRHLLVLRSGAPGRRTAQPFKIGGLLRGFNGRTMLRDHVSVLGPHQPGRYSASSLLARRSACSTAAAKSASTAFLLILRRKKSAHRNSLKGVVSLAKPPARRSSPARLRNGSSF